MLFAHGATEGEDSDMEWDWCAFTPKLGKFVTVLLSSSNTLTDLFRVDHVDEEDDVVVDYLVYIRSLERVDYFIFF